MFESQGVALTVRKSKPSKGEASLCFFRKTKPEISHTMLRNKCLYHLCVTQLPHGDTEDLGQQSQEYASGHPSIPVSTSSQNVR